jgi:glutamine cyclotransferase
MRRVGGWLATACAVAAVVTGLAGAARGAAGPTVHGFEVVRVYPHDRGAFTQGLLYRDGVLYESTGLNGRSSLRKVQLETGRVLQRQDVESRYFAEGLADWGQTLIQLTWQSQVGFVYDLRTFKRTSSFSYTGEGWGLARDAQRLVMSDGTATLRWLDPVTLKETARVTVTDRGAPVSYLNELEVVKGEIYANVWSSDRIAIVEPGSGRVAAWVDLTGLLPAADRGGIDVLNGIAYDSAMDRLFVTGKLWPKLFEIRLKPRR